MKPRDVVKIHTDDLLNLIILAAVGAQDDEKQAQWVGLRAEEIYPFLDAPQRKLLCLRFEMNMSTSLRQLAPIMRYAR